MSSSKERSLKETKIDEVVELPEKPKRPPSSFFLFAREFRTAHKEELHGSVSEVTKEIAEAWRNLCEEEKSVLEAKAAELKTRYVEEMKEYQAAVQECGKENKGAAGLCVDLVFPLSSVKKIAKTDKDVGKLSKEALQLVRKSVELFLEKGAQESAKIAQRERKKVVTNTHVCKLFHEKQSFAFLTKTFAKSAYEFKSTSSRKRKVESFEIEEEVKKQKQKQKPKPKQKQNPPKIKSVQDTSSSSKITSFFQSS